MHALNAWLSRPLPEPVTIWLLVFALLFIAYLVSLPFRIHAPRRQDGWTEQQIADALRIKQNLWKE